MGTANDAIGFPHYAAVVNAWARDAHAPAWRALRPFHDSDQQASAAVWSAVPDALKQQFPDGPDSVRAMDFLGMWGRGTNFPGASHVPPEVLLHMMQRNLNQAPNAFDLEGQQYDFLHRYPTPSGPMPPAGSWKLSPEEKRRESNPPPSFAPVI